MMEQMPEAAQTTLKKKSGLHQARKELLRSNSSQFTVHGSEAGMAGRLVLIYHFTTQLFYIPNSFNLSAISPASFSVLSLYVFHLFSSQISIRLYNPATTAFLFKPAYFFK